MEDNGARSNPQAKVELARLAELRLRLLHRAAMDPKQPRPLPPKVSPVLETVTGVLERAGRPMRACEIHAAAERIAGQPLLLSSVKAILAAYSCRNNPRFRRISRGIYELAR
jgi:hypothetical protein